MKSVCVIYSDDYLKHGYPGHIECRERIESIRRDFQYNMINNLIDYIEPSKAAPQDIMRVHDRDYVNYIFNIKEKSLDADTYMCPGSLDAIVKASGAAIDGVRESFKGRRVSFGLVRPPGHHAMPDKAMVNASNPANNPTRLTLIVDSRI